MDNPAYALLRYTHINGPTGRYRTALLLVHNQSCIRKHLGGSLVGDACGSRIHLAGFAILCLTARPRRHNWLSEAVTPYYLHQRRRSDRAAYSGNLVYREGIEPSTRGLRGHRSTTELPVHVRFRRWTDSKRRISIEGSPLSTAAWPGGFKLRSPASKSNVYLEGQASSRSPLSLIQECPIRGCSASFGFL